MRFVPSRTLGITFTAAALLMAIFTVILLRSRDELREQIHLKLIERDAAVLYPVALQMLETEADARAGVSAEMALSILLRQARQEGMLALALFDAEGATIDSVPASQLLVELPSDDYFRLIDGPPISRYHPDFAVDQLLYGVATRGETTPVLEILLPLRRKQPARLLGFVRYHLDARPLALELARIDAGLAQHTAVLLAIGCMLIGGVVTGAGVALQRSQRALTERNERLARANFELTLAAKASALGQITSHLIHGLQGPVAGLRAAVAGGSAPDWESAATYTERLQSLIRETVDLLGDARHQTTYELSIDDIVATIRNRAATHAAESAVTLTFHASASAPIDSHRGGLLCLIAANLVQNAIDAAAGGGCVDVHITRERAQLRLQVSDDGPGIPPEIRAHLFQPGRTTKPSGTGLGLAISHLLARQLGGDLILAEGAARGTTFEVTLPLDST